MTRKEALDILTHNWTRLENPNYEESELDKAYYMAIEALSAEAVQGVGRYENATQKLRELPRYINGVKPKLIKELPTEAEQGDGKMIPIELKKRYPHSRDEDITDAFMRGYKSAQAEQGEWIFNTDENNGKSWNICSNCGHSQFHATNYCPNCGAVMSVPIQPVELKKPFTVDEIPQNYEPRILGNVEVVVRCRNCKHYRAEYGSCTAEHWDLSRVTFPHVEPNDYCSYAENKK